MPDTPIPSPDEPVIVTDTDPLEETVAGGLEALFEFFVRYAVGGSTLIVLIVAILKSIPLLDNVSAGLMAFLVAFAVYALSMLAGRLGYGIQLEAAVNLILENWYVFAVLLVGSNRAYEWASKHNLAVLGKQR